MSNKPSYLIFTDLDGTLLDHFSYSHAPADQLIPVLQHAGIPIIINTSKTFAEVTDLQSKLGIQAPFIVENGAAVFLPKSLFIDCPKECHSYQNYWMKTFSQPRETWIELLKAQGAIYCDQFQGFSELSAKTIANLTGLTLEDAEKANQRMFNEPVLWHDNEDKADEFISHIKTHGANVLRGGRFIHVGDFTDKGRALEWLASLYHTDKSQQQTTIALGDGDNDTAMLEAAHLSVQVRSPVHSFPTLNNANFIYQTQGYGPQGWVEAITFLTQDILNPDNTTITLEERKYG